MMFRCALLLLVCFSGLGAGAQHSYLLTHFTNANGLPTNAVNGIEWDASSGLLWIATEAGLIRWDGSSFETQPLNERRMMSMGPVPGRAQKFYTYDEKGSISVVENGEVRDWNKQRDGLPLHFASGIPDGKRASDSGRQVVWPPWLTPVGNGGRSFLIAEANALYLQEDGHRSLLHDKLESIRLISCRDQVFVSAKQGLWVFDRASGLQRLVLPAAGSFSLIENEEGQPPMIAQKDAVYRLVAQPGTKTWSTSLVYGQMPPGVLPFRVRELKAYGIIILADRIKGLFLLRPKMIRQLTDTTGSFSSAQLVTYGQALLPDGRIVAHSGVVYDRKGAVPGLHLPIGGSQDLFAFGNYVYFPHYENIFRYNVYTETTEQLTLLPGSSGGSMVATKNQLYVLNDREIILMDSNRVRTVFRFPAADSASTLHNLTAIEWTPGQLLVGSNNFVRLVDLESGRLQATRVAQKAAVRHLWRRSYGAFICTYGDGIFLLQNNRVYPLPRDKSDYLRFAHSMAPDGHGFCYISTNNGLFKVSEAALHSSAISGAPVYYHFLGVGDGLEQTEFNGGSTPSYLRLPDGTLSFPTMNGLAQLHPDSVRIAQPVGKLLVQATADGRKLDVFPADLPGQTRVVQFDVTVPFWGSPENLYAWYRLRRSGEAEAETPWIAFNPARQRLFNFSLLKPGGYDFEVRTFSGFGAGDFATRSFHFEVKPPWYATLAGGLLWALVLAALIWYITFLRTRQLRARGVQLEATVARRTEEVQKQKEALASQLQLVSEANDLKERLIAVISHNIITPLRYIHRATTMMREESHSLNPALREKALDSINHTSLELELLSVNLLNWIKLQHTQVHVVAESFLFAEIAAHVRSLLEPVARSKGQTIRVDADDTLRIFQFKDALQVILYNLVLNAILHSGGSTTRIGCTVEEGSFTMSVSDDGRGIPEALLRQLTRAAAAPGALKETDNQGTGFGFLIIRDLVDFIGAQLLISSQAGDTRIEVLFQNRDRGAS